MFDLFEKIEEALRELLTTFISSNLTTMFTDVNEKTGTIAQQVGQTPQGWNGSIYEKEVLGIESDGKAVQKGQRKAGRKKTG